MMPYTFLTRLSRWLTLPLVGGIILIVPPGYQPGDDPNPSVIIRHAHVSLRARAIRPGAVMRPIFYVSDTTTPNIACNDAAAITGRDRCRNNALARTVPNGATNYVTYPGGAPSVLNYGIYNGGSVSAANRQAACGGQPFKIGKSPGPPDATSTFAGIMTSCDEYPFASTNQGGSGPPPAIIRGVPVAENRTQGGQLSTFYQNNAAVLKKHKGEFQVCITIGSTQYGSCTPTPY